MRTSIIGWSAFSGAVLGLFVDAILIGVASLSSGGRVYPRWAMTLGAIVLGCMFVGLTVLGYLEGRLKAA
jgi:hypothetical protein